MKAVLLTFLLGSVIVSNGQELPAILENKGLRKGIYLSFEEFAANDPSVTSHFQISRRSSMLDYKLTIPDSAKNNIKKKDIWGVCNGSKFFINELAISGKYNFRRLEKIGRYCYFIGNVYSSAADPLQHGTIQHQGEAAYILNINNGKIFRLTPEIMKTILKNSPALLGRQGPRATERLKAAF